MPIKPHPVKKKPKRAIRQKTVAIGRKKQVIEFVGKISSFNMTFSKLSNERKYMVTKFMIEKGDDLKHCGSLKHNYMKFVNMYSTRAVREEPFELITSKEEKRALRQMKLFSKAVKEAKEQGLF